MLNTLHVTWTFNKPLFTPTPIQVQLYLYIYLQTNMKELLTFTAYFNFLMTWECQSVNRHNTKK